MRYRYPVRILLNSTGSDTSVTPGIHNRVFTTARLTDPTSTLRPVCFQIWTCCCLTTTVLHQAIQQSFPPGTWYIPPGTTGTFSPVAGEFDTMCVVSEYRLHCQAPPVEEPAGAVPEALGQVCRYFSSCFLTPPENTFRPFKAQNKWRCNVIYFS